MQITKTQAAVSLVSLAGSVATGYTVGQKHGVGWGVLAFLGSGFAVGLAARAVGVTR